MSATGVPALTLISSDNQLNRAAEAEGLIVENPQTTCTRVTKRSKGSLLKKGMPPTNSLTAAEQCLDSLDQPADTLRLHQE